MNLRSRWRDLSFAKGLVTGKPFQCLLQVTNRCNLTCSFCDFWPNVAPLKSEMDLKDFENLERELSRLGTFRISIEGGEPYLRSDLRDIVRIFGRRHLPVLYTNGWYVTEKNAADLWAAGLVQVGVSIDYADAARHDAKRGAPGTTERAWRAVEHLRDTAPRGARQVHVMTVLMKDNRADFPDLLQQSAEHGVGHSVTLLSKRSSKRGHDEWPAADIGGELVTLWKRNRHFRVFRSYLEGVGTFLKGGDLPACHAGKRSFNIDHLGFVSPCIEKIDVRLGNIRQEPLTQILARREYEKTVHGCQDCWTLCRGFNQALGKGGSLMDWRDLGMRVKA